MLNRVTFTGRIIFPELRTTSSGKSVAKFKMVVYGMDNSTNFIRCVAFGEVANFILSLKKGVNITIEGWIRQSRFVGNDGIKREIVEVVVEHAERAL